MTNLFYLIGLIFLIYEINYLFSIKEKQLKNEKFKKLLKEFENKKWDDYSEEYKNMLVGKISLLIFVIFFFVGLLSQQWFTFLLYLIAQFVIIGPLSKLFNNTPLKILITGINTIIGIIFSLFIILNHYHLHIDTYQIFIEWWSKL